MAGHAGGELPHSTMKKYILKQILTQKILVQSQAGPNPEDALNLEYESIQKLVPVKSRTGGSKNKLKFSPTRS